LRASQKRIKTQLINDFGNWGHIFHVDELLTDKDSPFYDMINSGFSKENSRMVMSVCPDDINRSRQRKTIETLLIEQFGEEFHLGTLGAYPIGGLLGIITASHHVPLKKGIEDKRTGNLIFFISPHLGLTIEDDIWYGYIYRANQEMLSTCCDALMNFLKSFRHVESLDEIEAIKEDDKDIAKSHLFKELIDDYKEKLIVNLHSEHINNGIIKLSKLNYELVMKKFEDILESFYAKEHFKGKIAVIGGITINTQKDDFFILKKYRIL
jgi:hypothetical protein